MKKMLCFLLIGQLIILTSCGTGSNNIIEEIAPAILYYYEKGQNEKYRITTMVPPIKNEERVILSSEETLLKDIKYKLNAKYFREIKDGQLRLVFFSEDLAKEEGIKDIINALYMDNAITDRIFLGIVKGDFIKFISENTLTDFFLFKEMKHNVRKGEVNVTDMHQYLKGTNSNYADPYLPYYSLEGEEMHYSGIALMKQDKMIHSLNLMETKFFNIFLGNVDFLDALPLQHLQASIGLSNVSLKININDKNNSVDINMDLRGIISEYQGDKDLSKIAHQKELKKEIHDEIHKNVLHLLKSFQKHKVDPLQLGLYTKKVFSQVYEENEWKDAWPNYSINLTIELNIEDYGTYQNKI